MCWIGLFLERLRRWQLSCRFLPCRVRPQIWVRVDRPPVCVSPAVRVITTRVRPFCKVLTVLCVLRVVVPLHFVKNRSLLSCRCVYPLPCSCPCRCPCLRLACFCPCPCQACLRLCLCRPCQTIHLFGCFASIRFYFGSLSLCDRQFHTVNSFLGTFDLGCPSPTDPSVPAAWFFELIQRFSITSTKFVHSVVQAVLINKCDNSDFESDNVSVASCSQAVTRLSKSVKESMMSPLNVLAGQSTSFANVVPVEIGSYRRTKSRHDSSLSSSAASSTNRCTRPLVNMINT